MPIAPPGRRTDGDKYRLGRANRLGKVFSEIKPPRFDVRLDELRQTWFVNRNLTPLERRNLVTIFIDAGYFMAEIGDTSARDQTHITRTDHCDAHDDPTI